MNEFVELPPEEPKQHHKRILMLLVKLGFTGVLLYLVFTRIESAELFAKLRNLSPLAVALSFLTLNLGQVISAGRTRYYFARAGYAFSWRFALALYYAGAMFNVVLPGGISGDGYKAWFLKKHLRVPIALGLRRILSERASGLLFLLLYAILLVMATPAAEHLPGGKFLLALALPGLLASYLLCIRFFLKEDARTALGAARFSAFGQLCVMLSALPLFAGLGADSALLPDYLALFMVSCFLSILPVSIGGAGIREATFFYGSSLLGLDAELGVAAALAFFAVHVSTSLMGVFCLKPLKKLVTPENRV